MTFETTVIDGFSYEVITGGKRRFLLPRLSTTGLEFEPEPFKESIPADLAVLKSLNTTWDTKEFATARAPWAVTDWNLHAPVAPCVVDLPIKFPGSNYRLPNEYRSLSNLLRQIASVESAINPRVDDYFAYLTLDVRPVIAGKSQRHGGAHVDGFQGARISPKLPIDHSFVIVDANPTVFHEQSFRVDHLDERYDDFFEAFDAQIDPSKARTYPVNTLLFMDAYTVHSSAIACASGPRSFVRLSYSVREFDRRGNGHNPMFDYNWDMVTRDFRAELKS